MAELFAIVGGIASFAQILDCIIQTSGAITTFCKEVKSAPIRLERIKDKLDALYLNLEDLKNYLGTFEDNVVLPADLSHTLVSAITRVREDVYAVEQECAFPSSTESHSMRRRLKWALIERHKIDVHLSQLDSSEAILNNAIQLTNL
jgi:hypothetical protein